MCVQNELRRDSKASHTTAGIPNRQLRLCSSQNRKSIFAHWHEKIFQKLWGGASYTTMFLVWYWLCQKEGGAGGGGRQEVRASTAIVCSLLEGYIRNWWKLLWGQKHNRNSGWLPFITSMIFIPSPLLDWTHILTHTHIFIHTHSPHTHIHTHLHTCTLTHTRTLIYTPTLTPTPTHSHTLTHTFTHTHTHTHTYPFLSSSWNHDASWNQCESQLTRQLEAPGGGSYFSWPSPTASPWGCSSCSLNHKMDQLALPWV
jgi:hypothetical protein